MLHFSRLIVFLLFVISPELRLLAEQYAPSEEYPSDSYVRPDVDYVPVFETLCQIEPGEGVLNRARDFSQHRLELIQWHGKTATEWEWQGRPNIPPPATLQIDERLNRVPISITVTIENRGETQLEVASQLVEPAWWTNPARISQNAVAVGVPALAPGETKQVEFDFDASKLKQPLSLSLFIRDSKDTQHYRLVFSHLEIHYASSHALGNPKLTVFPSAAAGANVSFRVSGTGGDTSGNIDIQCEENRWTLWRVRLTDAEKSSLTANGSVEVKRQVPWFLPSRKLSAVLIAGGGRLQGTAVPFEITNASHPDFPRMKRRMVGGVPTVTENGKPLPWCAYSSYDFQPGNVNEFGAHGTDLFLLVTNAGRHVHQLVRPTWPDAATHDYDGLDEAATMALAANPNARLLLRVSLDLPPFWFAQHPDDLVSIQKGGKNYIWEETGGVVPPLASMEWREQQAQNLKDLLVYARKQPWAGRVVGVFLCGEVTEEWFAWASNDTLYADYSQPQQTAFQKWCGDHHYSFDQIPSPETRGITGTDFFPDTDEGRAAAAYADFNSYITADTISYFAKATKEDTNGRSLVGAFYGYTVQLAGEPRQNLSGQMDVRDLLDDPNFDFFAGIPLHDWRTLESAADMQSGATASLQLAGKTYENEIDLFSWLHPSLWHKLYNPNDPRAGAISEQRRVLADDVVHGLERHWFSLFCNWHHDDGLQNEFQHLVQIQADSLSWDRTPQYQIAFVLDDATFASVTPFSRLLYYTNKDLLHGLMTTGAPVGVYLLSDIDKIPANIKMIVVASAFAPHQADLQKLKSVIDRGGRTIVVVGPVGLVSADTKHWDDQVPAQITGLPLIIHHSAGSGSAETTADHRKFIDMPAVNPSVTGDGSGWAVFSGTTQCAGLERPLDGHGRLIWSALPPDDSALLRSWAQAAGITFYAPLGCSVQAGKDVVAVTAPQAGSVQLQLVGMKKVEDVFDGTTYVGPKFNCNFELGQTRLFHRQP